MATVLLNVDITSKGATILPFVTKELEKVDRAATDTQKKLSALDREMQSAGKSVLQGLGLGAGFSVGTKAAEMFMGVVKAVPAAILDAARAAIQYGSSIDDLSKKTGMSAEALQRLGSVAQSSGTSLETITGAITKMQTNLIAAPRNFQQLGLSVDRLKAMEPDKAFAAIAAKIAEIRSPAEQAAAAISVFGRSGAALLPLFKSNVGEAADEAQRLGQVLSNESIAALDEMGDRLGTLDGTWEGFTRQIGAAIATNDAVRQGVEDLITTLGRLSSWVGENGGAVQRFLNGLGTLGAQTQAGKVIAIGTALLETGPPVKTPHTFGMDAPGIFLPPEAFNSAHKEANKLLEIGKENEKIALRHARAAQAIAKAYRDAWRDFTSITGRDATGMDGSAGLFGSGPLADERRIPGLYGIGKRTVGMYQDPDFRFPSQPSPDEMAAAVARANALDRGESYEKGLRTRIALTAEAKAAALADAAAVRDAWMDVAQTFLFLGDSMGGWAGATIAALGLGVEAWQNYGDAVDESATKAQKIQAAAAAGQAAINIFMQNRHNLNGGQAALSGAAQGAAAGAAFGVVGAVVGGLAGGLIGFFSGSKFRRIAKDAGAVLGVELGKEAVEAIEATMNDLDVSAGTAALLNITTAIGDSGKAASSFAPQLAQLMAGIKNGTVPAAEGLAQVNEVFSLLRQEMADAGSAGFIFLDNIVRIAKATGTLTSEMKAFLKETGAAAGPGMKALFDNVLKSVDATVGALGGRIDRLKAQLNDPATSDADRDRIKGRIRDLESQSQTSSAVTAARLNDLGILAAGAAARMREAGASTQEIWSALGPAIDSAIEAAARAGVALTGPFAELASQRAFEQLNESSVAAAYGLEFVARAAGTSAEAIGATSREAKRLYDEMYQAAIAMGHTEEQARRLALSPLSGTLGYLAMLARMGVVALDEETRAMIDQAEAAGLLDLTPQERAVELAHLQLLAISALVTAFGATLPAAVQAYIDSLNNIPQVPGPPGTGPGPGPGDEDPQNYALGGFIPATPGGRLIRVAEAGEGEWVIPQRKLGLRGFPHFAGGGWVPHSPPHGQLVVAGEREAELVVPQSHLQAGGGGSGGGPVSLTLNGPVMDVTIEGSQMSEAEMESFLAHQAEIAGSKFANALQKNLDKRYKRQAV